MKGKNIFIIEHLESRVWRWCEIEYKHISQMVGKDKVWFTNLPRGNTFLSRYGKVLKESVKNIKLENICILDPEAKETLTPEEAKKIDYLTFGGILGDYPPKKRTKKELTKFISNGIVRNIGKKQLSTDNAVYVVHTIAQGVRLENIPFKDKMEIDLKKGESIILPYRYPLVNGKPNMSKELLAYLKKKRSF